MLEVISYRQLCYFSRLFSVEDSPEDPEARFVAVLRWAMAILKPEFSHKKPFNPVIGEHHVCWVANDEDDWTEFVAEQVSHHPPISSFFIRNSKRQIQMEGNLKFGVTFGGNSASVTTEGVVTITTPHETFHLEKSLPNMMINNIVMGTKYVLWDGDFSITSDSGYTASMKLSEASPDHNKISGKVTKDNTEIFEIKGYVGEKVNLKRLANSEKTNIYTAATCRPDEITYPPPSAQVRMDSLSLWKATSDAIIANDMSVADAEKSKVENMQRGREKARLDAGDSYEAQFFVNTTNDEESANWKFKNEIVVDRKFVEKLREQKRKEEEDGPIDTPSSDEGIKSPEDEEHKKRKREKLANLIPGIHKDKKKTTG